MLGLSSFDKDLSYICWVYLLLIKTSLIYAGLDDYSSNKDTDLNELELC